MQQGVGVPVLSKAQCCLFLEVLARIDEGNVQIALARAGIGVSELVTLTPIPKIDLVWWGIMKMFVEGHDDQGHFVLSQLFFEHGDFPPNLDLRRHLMEDGGLDAAMALGVAIIARRVTSEVLSV